jgi:hypothetical protein
MTNLKKILLFFLLLCSLGTLAISIVFLWTSGIALDEMISVTEYFDSYGMLYWLLLLISFLASLSCILLILTRKK